MRMTTNAEWLEIDGERVVQGVQAARETLNSAQGDVVLSFSCVRRIDPSGLRAMEELAGIANEKAVNVVLHGVNVDIYKVLKLVKLTSRFSFRPESFHVERPQGAPSRALAAPVWARNRKQA